MNYKAILLLILGVAIIIFPQYIRYWTIDEVGEKPTRFFIITQRITGVLFVIISIVLLVLGIS